MPGRAVVGSDSRACRVFVPAGRSRGVPQLWTPQSTMGLVFKNLSPPSMILHQLLRCQLDMDNMPQALSAAGGGVFLSEPASGN